MDPLPRVKFDPTVYNPKTVIDHAFPPIQASKPATIAEADKELRPNELVLGVEVDGEPRAYPINMLNGPSGEIINDDLAGTPIAATW